MPEHSKYGFPSSSLRTSTSVQTSPVGAPRAFAKASFAANLPAIRCIDMSCSAGVNTRSSRPSRPAALLNRDTWVTSMPMPTIMGYSTVTLLARFRGWSTSYPFRVASSQANICSGTVASNGWSNVDTFGSRNRTSA